MTYGKLRKYARNASAYATGYILGGHVGGFAAYKGAEYLDNSLSKMQKTRSQSKRTPTRRTLKGRSGKGAKRIKNVSKKRMGSTAKRLFKKARPNPRGDPLEISGHNDMSKKRFSIIMSRKKPLRGKYVGRYLFQETWDGYSSTTEGKQTTLICKNLMTSQQLLGSTLMVNRDEVGSWAIAPQILNPYANITNTATFPGGGTANDSFFIETIKAQLAVISTCTIPQKLKIMWLMYKKNSNQDPKAIWDAAITYESMGESAIAFPNLPTAVNLSGAGGTTTPFYPGIATKDFVESNPFSLKMFKQYFKLLHLENFVLQPGDQRHFEALINVQKRFDIPYIRSMKNSSDDQYLGGITVIPIIVSYGGLVEIQKSSKIDITYGRGAFGILQNNLYKFKAVKADRLSSQTTFAGHPSTNAGSDLDPASSTTTKEFTVNVTDTATYNILT